MTSSNSWAELAGVFCKTRAAYLEHDAAKDEKFSMSLSILLSLLGAACMRRTGTRRACLIVRSVRPENVDAKG
jgi:hypothetical protein